MMLCSLLCGLAHTTKCDNNTALFWKCLHFSSAILKHSTSLMMVTYFTLDIHSPSGYNGVLCRNESVTPANGSVTRISPQYASANKIKDKAQQPLRYTCGYKLESMTQRRTSNQTCPSPAPRKPVALPVLRIRSHFVWPLFAVSHRRIYLGRLRDRS